MNNAFKAGFFIIGVFATPFFRSDLAFAEEYIAYPTNITGTFTYPDVPHQFDPELASDEYLRVYGYPPRPNKTENPGAYNNWRRLVSRKSRRIIPTLQETKTTHQVKNLQKNALATYVSPPGSGLTIQLAFTENWSGVGVVNNSTYFNSASFYAVFGEFSIPAAQAVSCDANQEIVSMWVGLDGLNSSDIIQAGSNTVAYCYANQYASFADVWYEWFPNPNTYITNFTPNIGDTILVEVYATGPYNGGVYINDETQNISVSLSITPPSGVSFVGSSAEWIVERPENFNRDLYTLPNYTSAYMDQTIAFVLGGNQEVISGSPPSNMVQYQFTMYEGDNPEEGRNLSAISALGWDSINWQYQGP